MVKKPTSLSAALMPVDEEAAIPPRTDAESQQAKKAENGQSAKAEGQKAGTEAVGLNFKVQPGFRRDFRLFCAQNDLSLVEALAQAFELLKRSKGNG
jgi:hypothetical protein